MYTEKEKKRRKSHEKFLLALNFGEELIEERKMAKRKTADAMKNNNLFSILEHKVVA